MNRLRHLGDAALIERSRESDSEAFAELWRRHHKAGLKAARSIAPNLDSDDLVSEAFASILTQLGRGNGPASNFRPYLYTVVRNTAVDIFRQSDGEVSVDELEEIPDSRPDAAGMIQEFNQRATKNAFESLPAREQEVLWYTEVEGLAPRKAAPILGISAGATSALAMRARNRLRIAWLTEHAQSADIQPACNSIVKSLPGYVKKSLPGDTQAGVKAHLQTCATCSELVEEAQRMYTRPGAAIATGLLGAGFASVLKLSGTLAVPTVATVLIGGISTRSLLAAVTALVVAAAAGGILVVTQPQADVAAGQDRESQTSGNNPENPAGPSHRDTDNGETDHGGAGDVEPPTRGEPSTEEEGAGGNGQTDQPPPPKTPAPDPDPDPGPGPDPVPDPAPAPDPRPIPVEPEEPLAPAIVDDLPRLLPAPQVSPLSTSPSRLALQGTGAAPRATVRLLVTSQPVPGDSTYGLVLTTRAWSNGYWAFANVGGISPLNVTVKVQQHTNTASSPWETVVENSNFPLEIDDPNPGDFNGVYSWYVRGWPRAHWALREVGTDWPYSSGQFSSGGGAMIPVPARVPAGESREYEVGYWVKGRFEPFGARLTVRG